MFFKNYFQKRKEEIAFKNAKRDYLSLSANYFDPEESNLVDRPSLMKIIKGQVKNSSKLDDPYSKSGPSYILISHPILRHRTNSDAVLKFNSDNVSLIDNAEWFGLVDLMFSDSFVVPDALELEVHNDCPVDLRLRYSENSTPADHLGPINFRPIDKNIFSYGRGDYQLDKLWDTKILTTSIDKEELIDVFKEVYSGTKYLSQLNRIKF